MQQFLLQVWRQTGTVRQELAIDLPGTRDHRLKRSAAFQDYQDEKSDLIRDAPNYLTPAYRDERAVAIGL